MTDEEMRKLKAIIAALAPIPKDVAMAEAYTKHGSRLTDAHVHEEWMKMRLKFAEDIISVTFTV